MEEQTEWIIHFFEDRGYICTVNLGQPECYQSGSRNSIFSDQWWEIRRKRIYSCILFTLTAQFRFDNSLCLCLYSMTGYYSWVFNSVIKQHESSWAEYAALKENTEQRSAMFCCQTAT